MNVWRTRIIVLSAIVLLHAAIVYFVARHRAASPGNGSDSAMITPITKEGGANSGGLEKKPVRPPENVSGAPDQPFTLPPIDVWPTDPSARPATELAATTGAPGTFSIQRWVRPDFPREWARQGHEGSAVLEIHVDSTGQPTEVRLAHGTGFGDLDQSAIAAARQWTFTPVLSGKQLVSAWAEIEIRFNAFRYGLTHLRTPLPETDYVPQTTVASTLPMPSPADTVALRRLIDELSSTKPTFATLNNTQPDFRKMRITVITWGRVRDVRPIGIVGDPRFVDWEATREFRQVSQGGTTAVRWALYEVKHERKTAMWKVAFDNRSNIWAAKADDDVGTPPASAAH